MQLSLLILGFIFTLVNSLKVQPNDCDEKYCYDLDIEKVHRKHHGTKTVYPRYTDFDINKEFIIPDCKPLKIWLLIRHGSRYPMRKEMNQIFRLTKLQKNIKEYYEKVPFEKKCPLCSADYELLKEWQLPSDFSLDNVNILAPGGKNEMGLIAKSLKKMFPTLFKSNYSKQHYYFLYSRERRTKFSYEGFVDGLFGQDAYKHIRREKTRDAEHLLKPYVYCNYSKENSKLVDMAEPLTFVQTPKFKQLLRDVSLRLGMEKMLDHTLVTDSIWTACKYEQSWDILKPSPWCVAFLPSHYELLDYLDDLTYYYKKGYGSPINMKLACSLINDMIYHLDNTESQKVVVYIVHSTLVTLFLNALGAFKDKEPLRPDNFEKMKDRLFLNSKILQISANFAMVKYECRNATINKPKFMFFMNQKPLTFDWCNSPFCDIDAIKKNYAHFVAMNCSHEFCDPNFKTFETNTGSRQHIKEYVLGIIIAFLVQVYKWII